MYNKVLIVNEGFMRRLLMRKTVTSVVLVMLFSGVVDAADPNTRNLQPTVPVKSDPNQCLNLEGEALKSCVQRVLDTPVSRPAHSKQPS
jgi:hypothetical protein